MGARGGGREVVRDDGQDRLGGLRLRHLRHLHHLPQVKEAIQKKGVFWPVF